MIITYGMEYLLYVCLLYVCVCFVSLLSHFWLINSFYLHLLYQPYVGLCQVTCVQSHQRHSHMRGPGVGCWFSYRSNCSHWSFEAAVLPINPNIYTDQWEPIVIYHSITFTGRYTTMQPTLLTSWLQLLRCRQSQLRFVLLPLLLHLRLLIIPDGYSTFHIDLASSAQS